ncbi:MAG: DUF1343 domain-containing protein [Flavobacteriaceae bacterium]|nr:DUF1343 domain-containing protein [Flavobacteriaceae bacterium]
MVGAEQIDKYFDLIQNKNVAIVCNQTSVFNNSVKKTHLVDSLIKLKIKVVKVFSPEHGFKGNADNGEYINDEIDSKTKIKIISLYGKKRKPSKSDLNNIDIVLFDIQDVGVRFYTYLSTLHYVMEACAESNKKLIILDRPNPNIHYVDGPIMKSENKSFLGLHPVPIVYGMSIGEYAKMINGEKWLSNKIKCNLRVIPNSNYFRNSKYILPIRPSPNLPNKTSINLYPSLCLLEQTPVSVGRGTEMQFQIYGHPLFQKTKFSFIPKSNYGAKNPKLKDQICYGVNLKDDNEISQIKLEWLINSYNQFPHKEDFFYPNFNKISGSNQLQNQIIKGLSEKEIKNTWISDLNNFKKIRKKYLIYSNK